MASSSLTPKQRTFVREYQLDLNATQAAIRAGYSAKTARSQGQRLLTNVDIRALVRQGQERLAAKAEVTKEGIVEHCRQIMETELRDVLSWDGKTLTVKAFKDIPGAVHPSIESIKQTKGADGSTRLEVKLHDKLRAISELNKMLGFHVTEPKVAPTFRLNLHMGGEAREQPADAGNPEALPEKSGGS